MVVIFLKIQDSKILRSYYYAPVVMSLKASAPYQNIVVSLTNNRSMGLFTLENNISITSFYYNT